MHGCGSLALPLALGSVLLLLDSVPTHAFCEDACTVTTVHHDQQLSFGGALHSDLVSALSQFCTEHVISLEDCHSLGDRYISHCCPPCGVFKEFETASSENIKRIKFSPPNNLDSVELSQDLYTYCHLTHLDPAACVGSVGTFYQHTCRSSTTGSIYSDDVLAAPRPWHLAHEPSSSNGQKDIKYFLKDALTSQYTHHVDAITPASFELWGKHAGSYLSWTWDAGIGTDAEHLLSSVSQPEAGIAAAQEEGEATVSSTEHTGANNDILISGDFPCDAVFSSTSPSSSPSSSIDETVSDSSMSGEGETPDYPNVHPNPNPNPSGALPGHILPDFDTDIASYFHFLHNWCPQTEHPKWYANCYQFLLNLTRVPRCTTTMDSGHCLQPTHPQPQAGAGQGGGGHAGSMPIPIPSPPILSPRALVERAFSTSSDTGSASDRLHIVILGAGPVGLMAANLLASLLQRRVQIVVFETRVEPSQTRQKKLYSREWLTELPLGFFVRCPKISQIISNFVHEDSLSQYSHLPINMIETLLLLSSREQGVTFIYDDYKKYLDLLSSSAAAVDIVFDATGHRLSKFQYPPYFEDYTLQQVQMPAEVPDEHVIVGHHQDLRYPMSLHRDSQCFHPYTLYFLKINFLSAKNYEYINQLEREYEAKGCTRYSCGPYFPFKTTPPEAILNVFATHPDEVVSNLVLISLTQQQARVITAHLQHEPSHSPVMTKTYIDTDTDIDIETERETDSERERDTETDSETTPSEEVFIRSLPAALLQEPALQTRGLNRLLLYLMRHASARSTLTLPYRYNPYMYTSTPVPRTSHHFAESTSMLRIGNSLLSGDATASTGLFTQFQLLVNIATHVGRLYYNAFAHHKITNESQSIVGHS